MKYNVTPHFINSFSEKNIFSFLMNKIQNWSWLIEVVEQLNRIPSKQHGTDVMRIRQWYV